MVRNLFNGQGRLAVTSIRPDAEELSTGRAQCQSFSGLLRRTRLRTLPKRGSKASSRSPSFRFESTSTKYKRQLHLTLSDSSASTHGVLTLQRADKPPQHLLHPVLLRSALSDIGEKLGSFTPVRGEFSERGGGEDEWGCGHG